MVRLMSSRLFKRLPIISCSATLLLLTACAPAVKSPPPVEQPVLAGSTVDAGDKTLARQLDGDLLYELLAGEFAGVRGDFETAVKYYLQAAEQTDDPQVAERAAHIAIYAQQYDQALAATRRWQALGGNEEDLARLQGLVFIHLKDLDNAVATLEKLLLVDGQLDSRAVASLGIILQKEAEPEFSLLLLERLNQRHPKQVSLLLLQARFEGNAARYQEALDHLQQVIDQEPDNADAYLIKAQVLGAMGDETKALEAVAEAVERRPDDHRLRSQYARMLVQTRSYDQAWDQYMELHQQLPENDNVLLSLGLLSIETGKTDLAKKYLHQLIERGFQQSQAYYYLGRIQQSEGDLDDAYKSYQQVMTGDLVADARIREASILAHQGKVDQALAQLQAMAHGGPYSHSQLQVYLAQGELLRKVNRSQDAMKLYNDALVKWPDNVDLLYARALTAEKLDMLNQTESDLRQVLKLEPDNANALNALGYTLADRTERLQEARKYIMRAAELLPDDPAVLDSLGWVYYRLGEMQKAIDWLRKAFAKMEDAEIAAHLGEVLWVNGQVEEADQIWKRGLEVEANHPILLDTMKRLKK